MKSLNTVTAQVMVDPRQLTEPTTMFVSGNDQEAKDWVQHELLEDWFGWEQVLDLGDITAARAQEMWLPLWLRLMGTTGPRRSTCAWLRRPRARALLRATTAPSGYKGVNPQPRGGCVPQVTDTSARGERAGEALAEFVRRLPKAELHLHIEGTLEPELLLELGRRNGVDLQCSSAEECRARYRFSDLLDFLDVYYEGVAVLVTEQDFHDLTAAYVRRVAADGARHVEVFFDPQSHVPRGVPFGDVVGGITRALRHAETELGVTWRLIMCFLRDRPAAEAMEMLELALPHRDVIAGVGLDSAELATLRARSRGCTRRRGRRASSPSPTPARRARRVHHGRPRPARGAPHRPRGGRDRGPSLQRRLAGLRTALTMCPLSNLELQVTPDLASTRSRSCSTPGWS